MASKAEAEKMCFECPLCLHNFKNATILDCGHTFCKGCLEEYDEQHDHLDHLVCPVCRQSTKLGENRVAGLTPNFSVKGVEDKLNVDDVNVGGKKTTYCSIHPSVYMDIFCVDCEIFVCLSCYLDTHEGHKVIKKEEVGRLFREKGDNLIEESKTREILIENCLDVATHDDEEIQGHLNNLEKDITDAFAGKLTILQQMEELLLKSVGDIRKTSNDVSKHYMAHLRQLMDNIKRSVTLLTDNIDESTDLSTLQAYHLQCREIENSLKKHINIEPMVQMKKVATKARFCPADEKQLAIGNIEQDVSNMQKAPQSETDAGVRQDVEEQEESCKITEIPASKTHNLKIVRKIVVPLISGMAVLSKDAVVVGYGPFKVGADCFYVSGERDPFLGGEVGFVYDIALLTDGRSVISKKDGTLLVYDTQGQQVRDMTYTCMDGITYPRLCSDQHDNIYAVNGTAQVFIFNGKTPMRFFKSSFTFAGNNTKPKRVPTGDTKPLEIHVTKSGVMINDKCFGIPSTVTVFDRKGHVGTSITVSDDDECLFAAVDSQDRVLVARMRKQSGTIGLTRYTIQGLTLTEEVTFNPLELHEPCKYEWSYMASLAPNMIAFAHKCSLYFIELAT